MSEPRIASPVSLLGCALLVTAAGAQTASQEDLTSKLRTAWEKFTERQQVAASYGARGEIALKQLEMERRQADLRETIRNMQIEIDGWRLPPNRWNSIQRAFGDEQREYRRQLTEVDRVLDELRLQWRQENELAIRQAEQRGERVKPLDRAGLLRELQRIERETLDAFAAAREALIEATPAPSTNRPKRAPRSRAPKAGRTSRNEVLRSAMAELGRSSSTVARLSPPDDFLRAFREFCGGKKFFG
jgi:hypothetical protein